MGLSRLMIRAVVVGGGRFRRRAHVFGPRRRLTTAQPSASGFCLADYTAVGFDLDNTLARYRLPALFELIHGSVREHLDKGASRRADGSIWPSARGFSQRGLLLDKKRGLLVKFDAGGKVDRAFKGFMRLSDAELHGCVRGMPMGYHFLITNSTLRALTNKIGGALRVVGHANFVLDDANTFHDPVAQLDREYAGLEFQRDLRPSQEWFNFADFFTTPTQALYADMVARAKTEASAEPLWHDLLGGIVRFYRPDGPRARTLLQTPSELVRPCPKSVMAWIQRLREAGTWTFLLTGSEPGLAVAIAGHALGPQWQDLFDLVVMGANKPAFFGDTSASFKVVRDDGSLRALGHDEDLRQGVIYCGGNWAALCERWLGSRRTLYIGDSLVDDTVAAQGCCDSVAIVEELAAEATLEDPEPSGLEGAQYLLSESWGSVFASMQGPTYFTKALCGAAKLAVADLLQLTKLPQSAKVPAFDGQVSTCGFYPSPPKSLVAVLTQSSENGGEN